MFASSLHPAIGVIEDGEGALAVADLKLVLFLHHLEQRGIPWGNERGRERERESGRGGGGGRERARQVRV